MKAEQRHSIRKKISLDILVNRDLADSKQGKTRDLSLSRARPGVAREGLVPGAPAEPVRTLSEHNEYALYRVPAYVVRADRDGVAFRFGRYDDQNYTTLVNLLYNS